MFPDPVNSPLRKMFHSSEYLNNSRLGMSAPGVPRFGAFPPRGRAMPIPQPPGQQLGPGMSSLPIMPSTSALEGNPIALAGQEANPNSTMPGGQVGPPGVARGLARVLGSR